MQFLKSTSMLILAGTLQFFCVTNVAAYASGMNSDIAAQSVHGFTGSGFAVGNPTTGSTTTCAKSGCHTGSAFPDVNAALSWSGPTDIPPGIATSFGVSIASGNASVTNIGFNATARRDSNHDRFGTFGVSAPVQLWANITQGGLSGPEIGHTAPQLRLHQFTWNYTATVDADFKFYSCINQVNFTGGSDHRGVVTELVLLD